MCLCLCVCVNVFVKILILYMTGDYKVVIPKCQAPETPKGFPR